MGTAASIPANEEVPVPVPYYYRDVDDNSFDSLVLDDDDQTVKSDNTTGNTRGVAEDTRDDDEPPHRIIHKNNAFEEEGGYTSFRRLPFRGKQSWLLERQEYEKGLIVNHIKKMKDLRNEIAAKRKARKEQRNKRQARRKRRKSPLLRRERSNVSTSSSISSISHDIDDKDEYYQMSVSTLLFSYMTCNACGTLQYK